MSHDCSTVYDLWTYWGKATTVDRNSPTDCCSSDIPGIGCTLDGNVTVIIWSSQSLNGIIPASIGNLKNLVVL
jgi:hypothetical protein